MCAEAESAGWVCNLLLSHTGMRAASNRLLIGVNLSRLPISQRSTAEVRLAARGNKVLTLGYGAR